MIKDKLVSQDRVASLVGQIRREAGRIVFTNGCFDVIHSGHVQYLEEARKLGDFLIVGLNSDDSVKRLKGPKRPVNNQSDRSMVLAALESVSYVVVFEEDTPYNLISMVVPDVLVKGGDWKDNQIIGSDLVKSKGGIVRSLSFIEGKSSTRIINSLRDSNEQ